MPTIRVTVLRDGEPAEGCRVALEVSHGMLGPEYTDSDGIAKFDVDAGEEGDVFADGSNVASWSSYTKTDITVDLWKPYPTSADSWLPPLEHWQEFEGLE